jgi:uncharacterized protein (TIGR02452 family)
MNRKQRTKIAEETIEILDLGAYLNPSGVMTSIAEALARCVGNTRVITPQDWPRIIDATINLGQQNVPTIEVTGETTLQAAQRMHTANGTNDLLALNFASAKNPGGGFLSGSQAQEEALARSTGLYKALLASEAYYTANRQTESKLYTDHAIFSPQVPVFRDDDGNLLEKPYMLTIHTAPAPNRGAIPESSPDRSLVATKFCHRMTQLFSQAAITNHRRLILGAWGCGVFRNDPEEVAQLFAATLFAHRMERHFTHICFAVYDSIEGQPALQAFRKIPQLKRKEKP